MKIQEYLKSGIVESYVLGLASPEEVSELERLLPLHAELRESLSDFEFQVELFAIRNKVPPPPGAREKIEERLRDLPAVKPVYRRSDGSGADTRDPSADYIPIKDSSPHIRVHKYWRPAFIVIFILSKIFLILFLYYYFQSQQAQKEVRQLEEKLARPASTVRPGK